MKFETQRREPDTSIDEQMARRMFESHFSGKSPDYQIAAIKEMLWLMPDKWETIQILLDMPQAVWGY